MFKKISLSVAAILAVVAMAKPPAAMAADRDDYRGRGYDHRDYRDDHRDGRYVRDYGNYWDGDNYYGWDGYNHGWDGYNHRIVVERHFDYRRFRGDRDHDGDRR